MTKDLSLQKWPYHRALGSIKSCLLGLVWSCFGRALEHLYLHRTYDTYLIGPVVLYRTVHGSPTVHIKYHISCIYNTSDT